MACWARTWASSPVYSQGQWDKLLAGSRLRPDRPGDQRVRMDRGARSRLPGDAPVLRLSIAVDGAARRTDPELGRPEAREARRRPLEGRRAGQLGGRHVCERRRRAVTSRSFDSTVPPTPCWPSRTASSTRRSRTCRRLSSTSDVFPGWRSPGAPESRGYYVIYVRKEDESLRDALDQGLARLIESGELRRLYEKYGIWNRGAGRAVDLHGPLELAGRGSDRARLGARLPVPGAVDRCRAHDARAVGHVDAAGDGARPLDRGGEALRAEAAADTTGGLRRAAPRHAADASAFRALLRAAQDRADARSAGRRASPAWRSTIRHTRRRSTARGCRRFRPARWRRPWRWGCRGRWRCGG